jgi:hypothetical protein
MDSADLPEIGRVRSKPNSSPVGGFGFDDPVGDEGKGVAGGERESGFDVGDVGGDAQGKARWRGDFVAIVLEMLEKKSAEGSTKLVEKL